eukprot:SAG22_NODE_6519_length_844_cov_1.104698_1_plen_264_part_10
MKGIAMVPDGPGGADADASDGESEVSNPLAPPQAAPATSAQAGTPDAAADPDAADAAVSSITWEQRKIGQLCATDGAFHCIRALVAATAVVAGAFVPDNAVAAAGMDRRNELLEVFGLLFGLAFALLLLPLHSARAALVPGGALERLAAGTQTLTKRDARTLAIWKVLLRIFCIPFLQFGLIAIVTAARGVDGMTGVALPMSVRMFRVFLGCTFFVVTPLVFTGWWHSMYLGSMLCRDTVKAVIKVVKETQDLRPSWKTNVAAP